MPRHRAAKQRGGREGGRGEKEWRERKGEREGGGGREYQGKRERERERKQSLYIKIMFTTLFSPCLKIEKKNVVFVQLLTYAVILIVVTDSGYKSRQSGVCVCVWVCVCVCVGGGGGGQGREGENLRLTTIVTACLGRANVP